jgi:hypothetical protein
MKNFLKIHSPRLSIVMRERNKPKLFYVKQLCLFDSRHLEKNMINKDCKNATNI